MFLHRWAESGLHIFFAKSCKSLSASVGRWAHRPQNRSLKFAWQFWCRLSLGFAMPLLRLQLFESVTSDGPMRCGQSRLWRDKTCCGSAILELLCFGCIPQLDRSTYFLWYLNMPHIIPQRNLHQNSAKTEFVFASFPANLFSMAGIHELEPSRMASLLLLFAYAGKRGGPGDSKQLLSMIKDCNVAAHPKGRVGGQSNERRCLSRQVMEVAETEVACCTSWDIWDIVFVFCFFCPSLSFQTRAILAKESKWVQRKMGDSNSMICMLANVWQNRFDL